MISWLSSDTCDTFVTWYHRDASVQPPFNKYNGLEVTTSDTQEIITFQFMRRMVGNDLESYIENANVMFH